MQSSDNLAHLFRRKPPMARYVSTIISATPDLQLNEKQ